MLLALLLFFVPLALARQPTCAVLLCNETAHAQAWLNGALDEMVVLLESVFGGFSLEGERIGGCFDKTTILNSLVCLERDDFPAARCYAKFCDFWRHIELFESTRDDDDDDEGGCAAPATREHDQRHKSQRVCRTLQQWTAIGIDKLYAGFDAFDAGNFTNATSLACVAEKLLRLATARLPPVFDDGASYRHQVLPAELAAFDMLGGTTDNTTANNDTNDLLIGTRTVRSFRRAADAPANANHSLIATYIVARVLERSVDEATTEQAQGGITELLWPVSGSIAPFDKTSLPPQTLCAIADQPSNLAAFDATRALPCLGPLDFAAVADEFVRCRAFPSVRIRRYDDLSAAGCCSTIVLMADIRDRANGTRFEPRRESLGYVAHYRSPCTFEAIVANNATPTPPSPPQASCPVLSVCPDNTGQLITNATCAARNVTGLCRGANSCEVFVFDVSFGDAQGQFCSSNNCTADDNTPCTCAQNCVCEQQPTLAAVAAFCVPANVTAPTPSPTPTPSPAPSGNAVFDPHIEAELVARIAAPDLCLDVVAVTMRDVSPAGNNTNTTAGNTTTASFSVPQRGWRPPREGLPITLSPGESRCIGGERAGAQCSLESECGADRTCRLKPGTKQAFCYDRFAWSEAEPCIYAGELTECPYGYCYGAADGHDGGAYPLLYEFREQNCGDRARAMDHEACPSEVLAWFEHPKIDSVQ